MKQQTINRFFSKITKSTNINQCWQWTAGKDKDGYGKFWYKNRTIRAHKFSYFLHKGYIIKGKCILHVCDNPECTNPKHLFMGTFDLNNKDRASKGRSSNQNGSNNHQAKLTEKDIIEIRKLYATKKYSNPQIANLYNVQPQAIFKIVHRLRWKHI